MDPNDRTGGISRRQALKRVAAAGAVVWAAPAIQTLNMPRAWAAGSPIPTCYSVKLQPDGCVFFNGNNANAFTCIPPNTLHVGDGCANVALTVNADGTWTVTLGPGCYLESGFTHGGPPAAECGPNPAPAGTTGAIVFRPNDNKYAISNVQLNFCCLPVGR